MSLWLKQSTAVTIVLGPFVDSTDGVTAETALTISQADVRLSKNAGAFAQKNESTSCTHMENGYYSCPLNTTDTGTLGSLFVAVNESGALPVWVEYMVVAANVYDSLIGGGDTLDVQVTGIGANVITTASINDGAFTAAKFASDFLTAAKVASDVGTEIAAAVWNALTSGLSTASSIGKLLVDNVNATVSSRASQTSLDTLDDFVDTEMAAVLAAVDTEVAAIKAKTDNLPPDPADASDISTLIDALPTASEIADAVLDDAITEPGGVFSWGGATLRNIVGWLGLLARNKITQDSTETIVRNDADSADIASSAISDSGGTFTRGEWT